MFALTDWLKFGAAFCLGPAFVGGVLTFVFASATGPLKWLAKTGAQLLYGPLITPVVAPLALAVFALLLRFGAAGWAAILVVATLAAGSVLLFTPVGLHKAVLWDTANSLEPDALAGRG
ncbi:hypothetical protein [Jannaschia pohangensis]|uniref:Uncharacterized protein n=1 Tax=Jannaschia pohangensis TaxID=390807 RepID=A0A1I3QGE8_9RHOB|nr:hypothetical protein [Jannaschia pohangensis]SFJ32825.1 hypothetical protein SAMN04488095_2524 [Jannaschia pohangensis]